MEELEELQLSRKRARADKRGGPSYSSSGKFGQLCSIRDKNQKKKVRTYSNLEGAHREISSSRASSIEKIGIEELANTTANNKRPIGSVAPSLINKHYESLHQEVLPLPIPALQTKPDRK